MTDLKSNKEVRVNVMICKAGAEDCLAGNGGSGLKKKQWEQGVFLVSKLLTLPLALYKAGEVTPPHTSSRFSNVNRIGLECLFGTALYIPMKKTIS